MSGGGGGGGGLTGDQKREMTNRWEFDWSAMQNNYLYQDSVFKAENNNNERIRRMQNQAAINEWQDKEAMRIYDYNNKLKAYNASIQSYEKQKGFNSLALEITTNDNNRKYNERLVEIGFKNEQRLMDLNFNKRDLTQKIQGQRSALINKAIGARLEGLQKEGKVRASGQTGRSAAKNLQSALAEQGSIQAMLVDQLTREESGYNFAVERQEKGSKFAGRQLRESMKSARGQYEADIQKAQLDKYGADLKAEANVMGKPTLPPQMSKPIELPKPEIVEPPKPPSEEQWHEIRPALDVGGGGGGGAGWLGMALQVGSMFMQSDDRLKYDITRVGTSPSGIPEYTFKYRMDGKHGPTYKGTSAQDLIAMGRTDAVGQTEKGGFYGVDYSKLDVDMEVITTT